MQLKWNQISMYDPSVNELRQAIADIWGMTPSVRMVERLIHTIVDGAGEGSWLFGSATSPCHVSWTEPDSTGMTMVVVNRS